MLSITTDPVKERTIREFNLDGGSSTSFFASAIDRWLEPKPVAPVGPVRVKRPAARGRGKAAGASHSNDAETMKGSDIP